MGLKRRLLVQLALVAMLSVGGACIGGGGEGDTPDGGELRDGNPPTLVVIQIEGMTCIGCTERIRAALVALDGIVEAEVTLTPMEARVQYWPDLVTPDEMIDAIQRLGYRARVP